jgi:uncharacterized OsmC-like protein
MTTLTAIYQGNLRTQATHTRSGQQIITDAPVDNQGRGEAFSPTDLVCAALSSCMMTIMGQVAAREQVNLEGLRSEVVKIMDTNPRRIKEVIIKFEHPSLNATDVQKEKLMRAAHTCPVALSLAEGVKQTVEFIW